MTDYIPNSELRLIQAGHRLGSYKACADCGESDPRLLELHHIAGRANHGDLVCLCRNCHRKQSDAQRDHPTEPAETTLDVIGHYLLGLAELLIAIAERLKEFARLLFEYEPQLVEAST